MDETRISVCDVCGEVVGNLLWGYWGNMPHCRNCDSIGVKVVSVDAETQLHKKYKYRNRDFKSEFEDKEYLIIKSHVREVFTPAIPISNQMLFHGRRDELVRIIRNLNTPGMHSLVYGDRGVGKSSLANVAAQTYKDFKKDKLDQEVKIYFESCDPNTTFESLIRRPLKDMGIDLSISDSQIKIRKRAVVSSNAFIIGGEGEIEKEETITYIKLDAMPSYASAELNELDGLIVVDEAESLKVNEKLYLTSFIKHLSDKNAKLKLLIVGIAETATELMDNHRSVTRCLNEIHLERMEDRGLKDIVESGLFILKREYNTNLDVEKEVIGKIVELSAGYPYYTHLLALKCAESAIVSGKPFINVLQLSNARRDASRCSAGLLKRHYLKVINIDNAIYARILCAASEIPRPSFSIEDLEYKIHKEMGSHISLGELQNYLKNISSMDDSEILQYVDTDTFRFSDPRMSGFIRIIAND